MLKTVDIRIKTAIGLLRKSKEYIKQSRKNIDNYCHNKGNSIPLKNALTNTRIALEGYYKALMELHGLTEDEIYLFADIQNCRVKTEEKGWPYFYLKNMNNADRKEDTELSIKESVFAEFLCMTAQNIAIAAKVRSGGNVGSHFNSKEINLNRVEEVCNATSSLVDGELLYLQSPNVNKDEVDRETSRIYDRLKEELSVLLKGSCEQCEHNYRALQKAKKYGDSQYYVHKKCRYLEYSLRDNLLLTKLTRKYLEVSFEFEKVDIDDKFQAYKDVYEYLAIQNRETDVGKSLNSKISVLRHEILSSQVDNYSGINHVGKIFGAICIALLLFILMILCVSITG